MKQWKVTSKFFNNGKVQATIEEIETEKPQPNIFKSNNRFDENRFDEYQDFFDDQTEAEIFFQSAIEENSK